MARRATGPKLDGGLVLAATAAAVWLVEAAAAVDGGRAAEWLRLGVALAFIVVAAGTQWLRRDHPASLPLSLLGAGAAWFLGPVPPGLAASTLGRSIPLLGLSQVAAALLGLLGRFPSRRARARWLLPAAMAAGALAAAVGALDQHARMQQWLPGAALAALGAWLVATVVAAGSAHDPLDRLRARAALAALSPALLLVACAGLFLLGRRAVGAPPIAASTALAGIGAAGLGIPLAVAAALVLVGPFGVDRRARQAISFALTVGLCAALYLLAGAALLLEGKTGLRGLNVAFLFATVIVSAPLREALDGRLRAALPPPVDLARVIDRAGRALASALDEDRIAAILKESIEEALDPTWIEVRLPRADGAAAPAGHAGAAVETALVGQPDRPPGALRVGPRRSREPYQAQAIRLLESLAFLAHAALANAAAVSAIRTLNVTLAERVRERTAELDEAHARLAHAEKLASLGRLVAGVAHEINNPLNFVQANLPAAAAALDELRANLDEYEAELAPHAGRLGLVPVEESDGDGDDPFARGRGALAEMREGAVRVRRVVASLRGIAQGGALPTSPVDLLAAVERARAVVAPRVPRGVSVHPPTTEPSGATADAGGAATIEAARLPAVAGVAADFERLFVNLIANAVDAVAERGRGEVRIGLRRDGAFVEAWVDDDGPGVPAPMRSHLFAPFFTTKPEGKGVGLGLFICDGIVKRAGGTLAVEDGPLGGARFRVRLPVHPPAQGPSE